MTECAKHIMEFLDCPCEIFENEKDGSRIEERYYQLREQGKKEGFLPLIIVADDILEEMIGFIGEEMEDGLTLDSVRQWRQQTIARIGEADLSDYLDPEIDDDFEEFAEDEGGIDQFSGYLEGDRPAAEIIVAQVPAKHPWELAVWVPMGGFNDCPAPEDQAAMFKRWYMKCGAIPAVVTHDVWELSIERPVSDPEQAKALAVEMFGFCVDIVDQGVGSLGALASVLMDSSVWYFWWD